MAHDPRTEKLPRWAQQRIELLERNVGYWQSKAEAGPEDSDTFVHGYTDDARNGGKPLGKSVDIRFELPDGGIVLARIEYGKLRLHGTGNGKGLLAIFPEGGNTASIAVVGR